MNEIMSISEEQSMTIREIAEVLGSRPQDVLRLAKRLEAKGVITIISSATGVTVDFIAALSSVGSRNKELQDYSISLDMAMLVEG